MVRPLPKPKKPATPIVLMGYYNPIYSYGVEAFLDVTPRPPGSTA